ncbi:hypothetical protein ACH5RR_018058 [Cinchona calisaya]|uniref:Prolamin-like domain-containing protein n=1 Tax=Cinchona calisaya TaxID=153742 RepID=A0ABD2ZKZ5_9GENT
MSTSCKAMAYCRANEAPRAAFEPEAQSACYYGQMGPRDIHIPETQSSCSKLAYKSSQHSCCLGLADLLANVWVKIEDYATNTNRFHPLMQRFFVVACSYPMDIYNQGDGFENGFGGLGALGAGICEGFVGGVCAGGGHGQRASHGDHGGELVIGDGGHCHDNGMPEKNQENRVIVIEFGI